MKNPFINPVADSLNIANSFTQNEGAYFATDLLRARDAAGLKIYDDDNNGIFVEDGGNVGIGTTTPSGKFSIGSAAGQDAYFFYDNANVGDETDGQSLYIYRRAAEADDYMKFYINKWREGYLETSGGLYFTSGLSMYFKPSGNIHLVYGANGDTTVFRNSVSGVNRYLKIYGYPTGASAQDYTSLQIIGANHDLEIKTNNAAGDIILSPGATSGNVGIGTTTPINKFQIVGSFGRGAPVTKTADFTLAAAENWIISDRAATNTVTIPAASSWTGREWTIKTIQAQTVVSASSNVVPLAGGAAGTAILAATAGKWAMLVSDGTNWIIMQSN